MMLEWMYNKTSLDATRGTTSPVSQIYIKRIQALRQGGTRAQATAFIHWSYDRWKGGSMSELKKVCSLKENERIGFFSAKGF